eukprot:gene21730-26136_t
MASGPDFYGKIVAPAKFTAAVVSLVNATDGSSVAGVTANQYIQEGAPLTGLMVESFSRSSGSALGDSTQLLRLRMRAVSGTPGETYTIMGNTQNADWSAAFVTVLLGHCDVGSVQGARTCTECSQHYTKFDNSTTQCSECNRGHMECHGGANYTLLDGHWY